MIPKILIFFPDWNYSKIGSGRRLPFPYQTRDHPSSGWIYSLKQTYYFPLNSVAKNCHIDLAELIVSTDVPSPGLLLESSQFGQKNKPIKMVHISVLLAEGRLPTHGAFGNNSATDKRKHRFQPEKQWGKWSWKAFPNIRSLILANSYLSPVEMFFL